MQCCHAVDTNAIMDIDMRHAYTVIAVDNRYRRIVEFFIYLVVQLINNRHQMRNCLLHKVHRPFFQRFCKNRVVCISACLRYNLDRLIHHKTAFH